MRRFSQQYVEELLAGDEYGQLAELSAILCGSTRFSQAEPDYGLPAPAFVFIEALNWFAQAVRSGAWIYYEATPRPRQEAMSSALRAHAPPGYGDWYERGMVDWQGEERMRAVDEWIVANEATSERWLRELVVEHRAVVIALTG